MPGILRRAWFGVGGADEIDEGVEGGEEGIARQPAIAWLDRGLARGCGGTAEPFSCNYATILSFITAVEILYRKRGRIRVNDFTAYG